jgi:hypothetical protein
VTDLTPLTRWYTASTHQKQPAPKVMVSREAFIAFIFLGEFAGGFPFPQEKWTKLKINPAAKQAFFIQAFIIFFI